MRHRTLFALSILLLLLPSSVPAGTLGRTHAEDGLAASGARSANVVLGGGGAHFLHLRDVFATLLHFRASPGNAPANPLAALLQAFFHRGSSAPPTPPVPEPGTFGLLALGIAGLAAAGRRRRVAA